jgi:quercetin dioxygenase-like cupin family protein
MFCFQERLETKDLGKGVLLKSLGAGKNMNVLHWDMKDGSVVPQHSHPHEQFGYVIKGGFDMVINNERATLKAGDCYFIPSDQPHGFTALGDTEAIDVFSPVREGLPGEKKE